MTKRRRKPVSEGMGMVLADKAKSFLRWKDRESDSKPTPERLRKAQDGQASFAGGGDQGYKQISPVDAYHGKWQDEQQMAFAKFAYESAVIPQQKVTINYDATGGGNSHNRLGGLGAAQDWQREVFNRHHWVRSHLTMNSAYVLHALTGDLRDEATGRSYSFEDVGRMVFPHLRDKATSKGIGIGRFLGACDELISLYKERHLLEIENRRAAEMARDKVRIIERG